MKKILVIGAGPLQTPLIRKIKELGHIALCVDMNEDSIGFNYADYYEVINIVDKEKCLQYATEMNIDGVLTVATDIGIPTVSYIGEKFKLNSLPMNVVNLVKNKFLVRKRLFESGIKGINQFYEINSVDDTKKIVDKIVYPVIVKPCDGSGSKAVSKVRNNEELLIACNSAICSSLSKKAYIESYITGKEYGVESFVYNNEVTVLGIMKKTMTESPYYAELGHCIPSGLGNNIEEKIITEVKQAIKALGINNGSVNMDLLLSDEEEVCIIDIGARMGGNLIGSHIIPAYTGVDILGLLVDLALGNKVTFSIHKSKAVSTRLLNFKPGIVKKIGNISSLIDNENVLDIIMTIKEGDKVNEYRANIDTCGWVVVKAESPETAEALALETRNKIEAMVIIK